MGTGTGEPASRAIYTKIKAQADAGRKPWDLDVALVSMAVASQMVKEGLLLRFVPQMKNAALVKGAEVKEAFGVNVDGYVVPMFHNQIALAYVPSKVPSPPKSFDELAAWVKANPGRFGYNGIKGGVSGVGFTMGWVYWKTGLYKELTQGPFDKRQGAGHPRGGHRAARLQPAGGHHQRQRGHARRAEPRRDLDGRGVDRSARGVEERGAHGSGGDAAPARARAADLPALPGGAARGGQPGGGGPLHRLHRDAGGAGKAIVEKFGWYPGVDAEKVLPLISAKSRELLFTGVSAQDLARYSRQMPIKEYHDLISLAYEEIVR